MTIQFDFRHIFHDPGQQSVTQLLGPADFFRHLRQCFFCRHSQPDNAGHIFRTGTHVPFLTAALLQGTDPDPLADI